MRALPLLLLTVVAALPLQAAESDFCQACHDEPLVGVTHGQHAAGSASCVDCHGDVSAHLASPANPVSVGFGGADRDPSTGSEQCLGCHDDEQRLHWMASTHNEADVGCVTCHEPAWVDPQHAREPGEAVCLHCHRSLQAELSMPSRHPIKEGKTGCLDCHSSHGSSADAGELKQASINENCLSCHRDLRGPFLFEHEPVTEDCTLCHRPHGSAQPSLLKTRSPFLCQQCHLTADHPSQLADGRALVSRDSNLLVNGCTNCHSSVHGSNHPSGARLTR
ncbi:MAG: DmsE family decaheme c-type cytochrome [Proteobacteria bacterium]|nr:DmsE family decaheme c-type cytochrome [Pseudomonadota bacterium]